MLQTEESHAGAALAGYPHRLSYEYSGQPIDQAELVIVWGHGWGQNRDAFKGLASSFPRAAHLFLDFPGFGASPPPPSDWGTEQYAALVASLIITFRSNKKVLWVGHSFGCRVGIQLAAHHPDALDYMCLIAGAGLPRHRNWIENANVKARVLAFKTLKRLPRFLIGDVDRLRARFGSTDYKNAGPMRDVLLRVIREDLSDTARSVTCPCLLIYGAEDSETPPEIGVRLAKLIPKAELSVLPNQDHYTVLANGRHIVAKRMLKFLDQQ